MRDEESETQRKAHAKRVRETRRSTQGVTLDEIKSAEQLVKKKAGNGTNESTTPGNKKPDDIASPLTNDNGAVSKRGQDREPAVQAYERTSFWTVYLYIDRVFRNMYSKLKAACLHKLIFFI